VNAVMSLRVPQNDNIAQYFLPNGTVGFRDVRKLLTCLAIEFVFFFKNLNEPIQVGVFRKYSCNRFPTQIG
jgi:hypothetical protein